MKKTLLITTDFLPRTGGVAKYYSEIVKRLDQDKINVLVINDISVGNADLRSLRVLRKKWLPLIPRYLQAIFFICHARRKIKPDILWIGDILPFGTAAFILKKIHRIKEYIISTHGLDINLAFQNKPKLAKKILNNAKAITANSNFTKSILTEKGIDAEKIIVVYPGVNTTDRRGAINRAPTNAGTDKNFPILLTVSRLVARKGIDDVIKALPSVWEKFSGLQYHIAGDGPERKNLEALAQDITTLCHSERSVAERRISSGSKDSRSFTDTQDDGKIVEAIRESHVQGNIVFHGNLQQDKLDELYNQASLFILTPKQIGPDAEGFGIVYLEANAHGLPVIATRTGGVPEAVEDGVSGLLVEQGDVSGITKTITTILEDSELTKKLGKQGKERTKQFSWDKSVKVFEEIL